MKDMKMKKMVSGRGGADCRLCKYRQTEWMIPNQIMSGFDITHTATGAFDIYEKLVNADGEIRRKSGDYEIREGMTKKPLTTSNQWSICVLHSKINCTAWFVKLLARLNSGDLQWVERENCDGDRIREGAVRVLDIIQERTGINLHQVCGSLGKGVGSADGNQSRRLFSESSRSAVLVCVREDDKEVVGELHKNLSAILRLLSCEEKINVHKYQKLVTETSLLIAHNFHWSQINYTLHGILHHSHQLIVMNHGIGLGELSEEALEANNKFVRRFLEMNSRKTSPQDQLEDVMGRLLERSDPYLLERKLNFRSAKKPCSVCGSKEHSSRKHAESEIMDSYSDLVDSVIVNDI